MPEVSRARALLKPLLIITAILGVIHFFIFQIISTSMGTDAKLILALVFIDALILLPVGVLIFYTSYRSSFKWLTYFSYMWLGFFHLMFHFALIELVIFLIRPHEYSYWVLIAAGLIALWSIYKGFKFPKVNRYWLKAPAFLKGKTLVQISDLHIGMLHLNQDWLQKVVGKINELQPDMVAITGDLVEGAYDKISTQLKPLAEIKAAHKFYVTGNHEYIHFSDAWESRLQELGFTSLHNSSVIVPISSTNAASGVHSGNLLMAGVPDRMVKRFIRNLTSDPELALKNSTKSEYKILLAHEPSSVYDLKTEKPDIIITGHTHGGQIFPFSFYVRMVQPLSKGFKLVNSVLIFANQGTGFWGPPMRWFTDSEIAIFEFID